MSIHEGDPWTRPRAVCGQRAVWGVVLAVVGLSYGLGPLRSAQATVGPPIKIRMAGDTRQAVSGQVYAGVFEVHIGRAGTVADIQIEGAGWAVQQIDRPAGPKLVQPGVLRIPFRAVPGNADQPIRLSLTYEGRTISQTYEIGPAYFARAGQPGTAQPVPSTSGLRPEPPDGREEGDGPALQGGEAGGHPPKTDAPRKQAGTENHLPPFVTVVGRIVYTRPDGKVVGVDRIYVEVRDEDPVGHDVMWSGYTDRDGYFNTGPLSTDVDGDGSGPDFSLYFETNRPGWVDVTDHSVFEWTYTFDSGEVVTDWEEDFFDFGWWSAEPGLMPALHLFSSTTRVRRFVRDEAGIETPKVQVIWPADRDGAMYSCFWEEIYMPAGRDWQEDTLAHEYGHHFECKFGSLPSPNYCNGVCDSDDSCGHCFWCDENESDAWHEGFADWLASAAMRSYRRDYEFDDGCSYEPTLRGGYELEGPRMCGEDSGSEYAGTFAPALITEGFVALFLRDIEDNLITDCLALGPGPILNTVLIAPGINSVKQFISWHGNFNPALWHGLWKTAYNVDPSYVDGPFPSDTSPPAAVTEVWSPTHPLGVGGPLPCVTVQWSPPFDDVTGAHAYSTIWSSSPTSEEPDLNVNVEAFCTGAAASRPIYPGNPIYIRIRAQDFMGNWGPSSDWFGPFVFNLEECPLHVNGIPDLCDISCNVNDWPIACEIPPDPLVYCGSFLDCGSADDCNESGVPDACDIASGFSRDCNEDGVPDDCQDMRHWVTPGGGSWHVATNWDSQQAQPPPGPCEPEPNDPGEPGVPGLGEDVCINTGVGATIVHSTGESQIGRLTCHDNLTLSASKLILPWIPGVGPRPHFVRGDFVLQGNNAMLRVQDNMTLHIDGLFTWTGSNVSNSARLEGNGSTWARGGMAISQNVHLGNHRLILDGSSNALQDGRIILEGAASTIHIKPGSTWEHIGGISVIDGWFGDEFINEGTFIKSQDTNERWINVYTKNEGLMHVKDGTLRINRSSLNAGNFLADPGAVLRFGGGGHTFEPTSSITAETLSFVGGIAGSNVVRGTYNVSGSTTVAGHPLTFAEEANIINYGSQFSTTGHGTHFNAVVGSTIYFQSFTGGTANFNSGDPVVIENFTLGGGSIGGLSEITVNNLLTWNASSSIMGPGVVNANGDTVFGAGGGQKTLHDRTFNNAGTATFHGHLGLSSEAIFNNLPDAVIDIKDVNGSVFSLSSNSALNNEGTLIKSGTGTSTIAVNYHNSGTVEVKNGVLDLYTGYFGLTNTQTVGETILNGGNLSISSPGTPFNLQGGRLTGNGTVTGNVSNSGGSVEPGLSTGILSVTGNYTQGADAALKIEIGGLLPGGGHDQLVVGGTAQLTGELNVTLIDGFVHQPGHQFVILTAGSVQGTFDTVIIPDGLTLEYNPGNVTLTLPCPVVVTMDLDQDCDVDEDDLVLFIACFSGPELPLEPGCEDRDFDGDGDVDMDDFAILQRCYSGSGIPADPTCAD